jgi:hypothetical protein
VPTNLWFAMTALLPVVLLRFYPSIYGGRRSDDEGGTPAVDDEAEEYWERKEISVYDIDECLRGPSNSYKLWGGTPLSQHGVGITPHGPGGELEILARVLYVNVNDLVGE